MSVAAKTLTPQTAAARAASHCSIMGTNAHGADAQPNAGDATTHIPGPHDTAVSDRIRIKPKVGTVRQPFHKVGSALHRSCVYDTCHKGLSDAQSLMGPAFALRRLLAAGWGPAFVFGNTMRLVSSVLLVITALLTPLDASSQAVYEDGSWGVVAQDGGKTCIVVLNSEGKQHALHFLVDGEQQVASIGILDHFLPEPQYDTAAMTITIGFGDQFALQLEFKRRFDGSLYYLAAELPSEHLNSVLEALRSGNGVNLSFENGDIWRIPPPKREDAASAIAKCWTEALHGPQA
jgi:hypothetical protein